MGKFCSSAEFSRVRKSRGVSGWAGGGGLMHPARTLAMRTPAFMLRVRGLLLNDGEGSVPGAARGHPR